MYVCITLVHWWPLVHRCVGVIGALVGTTALVSPDGLSGWAGWAARRAGCPHGQGSPEFQPKKKKKNDFGVKAPKPIKTYVV